LITAHPQVRNTYYSTHSPYKILQVLIINIISYRFFLCIFFHIYIRLLRRLSHFKGASLCRSYRRIQISGVSGGRNTPWPKPIPKPPLTPDPNPPARSAEQCPISYHDRETAVSRFCITLALKVFEWFDEFINHNAVIPIKLCYDHSKSQNQCKYNSIMFLLYSHYFRDFERSCHGIIRIMVLFSTGINK
jgi:hypothetical protein